MRYTYCIIIIILSCQKILSKQIEKSPEVWGEAVAEVLGPGNWGQLSKGSYVVATL